VYLFSVGKACRIVMINNRYKFDALVEIQIQNEKKLKMFELLKVFETHFSHAYINLLIWLFVTFTIFLSHLMT